MNTVNLLNTRPSHKSPYKGCAWEEHDGIISLIVHAENTPGAEWVSRMIASESPMSLGEQAEGILLSGLFKPTSGPLSIAILKGSLFLDDERALEKINAKAVAYTQPMPEAACLLWEVCTDECMDEMGLKKIVIPHTPVKDFMGEPHVLCVGHYGEYHGLAACPCEPGKIWRVDCGFAYIVSDSIRMNFN